MRYEYLHVAADDTKLWVISPDDTMVTYDFSPSNSIISVINELGREGWEMVAATSTSHSAVEGAAMWTTDHWWFKRAV